jgi:hypothetical protein
VVLPLSIVHAKEAQEGWLQAMEVTVALSALLGLLTDSWAVVTGRSSMAITKGTLRLSAPTSHSTARSTRPTGKVEVMAQDMTPPVVVVHVAATVEAPVPAAKAELFAAGQTRHRVGKARRGEGI